MTTQHILPAKRIVKYSSKFADFKNDKEYYPLLSSIRASYR